MELFSGIDGVESVSLFLRLRSNVPNALHKLVFALIITTVLDNLNLEIKILKSKVESIQTLVNSQKSENGNLEMRA